jgi:hypothetical protein
MKIPTLFAAGAVLGLAGAANAQQFIATNNLANTNFGTFGDQLITFDFANPAGWVPIGVIMDAAGAPVGGVGGLDYNGDGSVLYGVVSYDDGVPETPFAPGDIFTIDPNTGTATMIGQGPGLSDLAWDPVTQDLYGVDAAGQLWADVDSGSPVLVGAFSVPTLEVGLGFDSNGNAYVHDLITDIIYTSNAGSLLTLNPLHTLPYDSNFSQGLHVNWRAGNEGYHAALNNSNLMSENYTFSTQGQPLSYVFQGAFPIDGGSGLPEVEVGDLTTLVPAPGAIALLGLAGLAGRRRRRA